MVKTAKYIVGMLSLSFSYEYLCVCDVSADVVQDGCSCFVQKCSEKTRTTGKFRCPVVWTAGQRAAQGGRSRQASTPPVCTTADDRWSCLRRRHAFLQRSILPTCNLNTPSSVYYNSWLIKGSYMFSAWYGAINLILCYARLTVLNISRSMSLV